MLDKINVCQTYIISVFQFWPALIHSEATIRETVDMSACWRAAEEKQYNKPQMSSLELCTHAVSKQPCLEQPLTVSNIAWCLLASRVNQDLSCYKRMGNSMKRMIIWGLNTPDDFLASVLSFFSWVKQLDLFIKTYLVT